MQSLKQIPEKESNTELSRLQTELQSSIENLQSVGTTMSQADIASLDSLLIQTRRIFS